MRRLLLRLLVLCLVGLLVLAPAAGAQAQNVTVNIQNFAFNPPNITVAPGTTVTWVNNDPVAHTATATNPAGAFDSGTLQPGQSFSFTFNQPGTYAYHCAIHPFMTGTVTVTGGGSATTQSASTGAQALPETGGPPLLVVPVALALVVSGVIALALVRRGGAA